MTASGSQDFTVQEIGNSLRIRWGQKGNEYRLVRLARSGVDPRLPGQREDLTLQTFRTFSRILVYGERSGGGRDFLAWLRDTLDDADGEPWFFVQGDQWAPDLFLASNLFLTLDSGKDLKAEGFFLTSLLLDDSAKAASNIKSWAENYSGPKLNLLIRDLGRLPENSGKKAALALSKASEHAVVSEKIRMILVDTSKDKFEDTYDASGLARLSERFRLPWLTRDEVLALASHEHNNLPLEPELVDEIIQVTGGQPFLVQSVLRELRGSAGDQPAIGRSFRKLRKNPPGTIEQWKKDLVALSLKERDIRQAIEEYASGTRRSRYQGLPEHHISLYYGGWIRFDFEMECWKISSKLHAAYAHSTTENMSWSDPNDY